MVVTAFLSYVGFLSLTKSFLSVVAKILPFVCGMSSQVKFPFIRVFSKLIELCVAYNSKDEIINAFSVHASRDASLIMGGYKGYWIVWFAN